MSDANTKAESDDGAGTGTEREISLTQIFALSGIAICNEAAPFLCTCIETGLIARARGTETVAAFSAVTSCCQFATGLFGFLLSVVMNHVSKTIGAKAWSSVYPRARLAVCTAFVCGVMCAGADTHLMTKVHAPFLA